MMSEVIQITEAWLDEIEDMADAATEGPWEAVAADPREVRLKRTYWQLGGGPLSKGVAFVFGADPSNAALISATREGVPALVAEVRRLRARLARAEAACTALADAYDAMPDGPLGRGLVNGMFFEARAVRDAAQAAGEDTGDPRGDA